ncbi:unnamed protein product [Calypogeia fissa]
MKDWNQWSTLELIAAVQNVEDNWGLHNQNEKWTEIAAELPQVQSYLELDHTQEFPDICRSRFAKICMFFNELFTKHIRHHSLTPKVMIALASYSLRSNPDGLFPSLGPRNHVRPIIVDDNEEWSEESDMGFHYVNVDCGGSAASNEQRNKVENEVLKSSSKYPIELEDDELSEDVNAEDDELNQDYQAEDTELNQNSKARGATELNQDSKAREDGELNQDSKARGATELNQDSKARGDHTELNQDSKAREDDDLNQDSKAREDGELSHDSKAGGDKATTTTPFFDESYTRGFSIILTKSQVTTGGLMRIPADHCDKYMPKGKPAVLTCIRDGKQYPITYLPHVKCLSAGWRNFVKSNALNKDDQLIFWRLDSSTYQVSFLKTCKPV